MKFHDIAQNTEEWDNLRLGKITSSNYACIMANDGKAFGDPAKRYAIKLALERVTGVKSTQGFGNEHTERGHEQEPAARALYEEEMFTTVLNGGFFDCEEHGGSPDGRVGDKGLIEIKSVIAAIHYDNFRRDKWCPTKHWQMVGNLECTGRKWIDFVSYCPDFPPSNRLVIRRMLAEQVADDMEKLKYRRKSFNRLVEKICIEITD